MYLTVKESKIKKLAGSAFFAASALAGVMALTACSSAPKPPTEALQAAEQAIETAEQARVADYASPELGQAREKLTAARMAVQEEEMEKGQRLAEQSRAAAELALARAQASKANVVNDEMKKSTSTIKQEMQRNPGVTP
jgi:hypothetical protein